MELNDETTVRGILIIMNMALSGVCITLWRALNKKDEETTDAIKDVTKALTSLEIYFKTKGNG